MGLPRRDARRLRHGKGHRKAHPPALADLVPDGRAPARVRARDQAGRRGLQRDERRRFRAPLLRRPGRARGARHRPEGREAAGGLLRGRALHASAGELLPPADQVLGRRAGGAPDLALAARRPLRLRGAAAPGAPAALVGQAQPARLGATSARWRWPSPPRPAAASSPSGWRRWRPRSRAARRSSSTTTRSSATTPPSARWTRTTCSTRAASSTSSGTRTSATTSACSGSRGSARRSPTPPRPSTTSPRPRTSTRGPTRSAPTGSWASPPARHRCGSRSGSRGSWSATSAATGPSRRQRRAASSGAPARRRVPGPGAVFTTEYAQPRQLIAWVLGLGEHARLLDPQELGDEAAERIDTILERHADPEPDFVAEPVAKHDVSHGVDPVENGYSTVESQRARRDARSGPSASRAWSRSPGILIQAGREGRKPNVTRGARAAPDDRRGAARGPRRAERRQLRRRQLRAVRRGAGRRDRGRPRALQRQLRPPGAAAAAGGEGARGRDRPARRPPARGQPRLGAPEDRQGARRGPVAGGPSDRAQRRRRPGPRPHDQPGDRRLPARVDRVLQGERGRVHRAHDRALRPDQRARGLVRVQLRPGARTTPATSASTASSRPR